MNRAAAEFEGQEQAEQAAVDLRGGRLKVRAVSSTIEEEAAPAPYTTDTLIADGVEHLGWLAAQVMERAQSLYEQGWITYPRTDATRIEAEAVEAGRRVIVVQFGRVALGPHPRQDNLTPETPGAENFEDPLEPMEGAHEAIRPTEPGRKADKAEAVPGAAESDLYGLIWARFLASLMPPLRVRVVTAELETA